MKTYKEMQAEYQALHDEQERNYDTMNALAEKAREAALRYQRIAARKMGEYYKLTHKAWGCRKVCWTEGLLLPLLQEIDSRTGLNFSESSRNTFGLGCERPVFARDENGKAIAMLKFTPSFDPDDSKLYVKTGERSNRYAEGSIGDLNGFNDKEVEVESVEQVLDILSRNHPELKTA